MSVVETKAGGVRGVDGAGVVAFKGHPVRG